MYLKPRFSMILRGLKYLANMFNSSKNKEENKLYRYDFFN